MPCWCGERRPYYETSSALLSSSCAGTGELDCLCGGDQCVCHNHGTVECPGCGMCEHGSTLYDDDAQYDAARDAR
jgi:hypothetical protein